MAKYRQLYTEFWNDGFILDLTPEEKYFYIYLMTNINTTQCGVYELPKRIIETQTGYNRETVDKLLKRFADYNKIKYCEETKEIIMLNWLKYNQPNNLNAVKCVNKELKNVKNTEFTSIIYNQCINQQLDTDLIFNGVDLIMEPPVDTLQGACKGLTGKEVISNKKEITNNKDEVRSKEEEASIEAAIKYLENNIGIPREQERKKLYAFASCLGAGVIMLAVDEAVNYKVKNIKYIENILDSWFSKGLNTVEKVENYNKAWRAEKSKGGKSKSCFNNFEERKYDFEKLERQLLGWEAG